jgi:sugar phosphate isomerase/epimerase
VGPLYPDCYIFDYPVQPVMIKLSFKQIFLIVVLFFSLSTLNHSFAQNGTSLFPQMPGVVSYTYRKFFEKDVPSTLDTIKKLGFTDIEFSSLFGKTPAELRALIDVRGIKCSSFGISYDDFVNNTDVVAQNAKILGASYLRVAGMPHKGALTPGEMQKAIDDFNRVGKIVKEQYGLTFVYHNHGFEFEPYKDGTLYDYLVAQTNPKYVSFELDIFWAFFPGQDPAALLNKYGSRYKLMHLKDIKKGVTGNFSGGTSQNNDVALGTGQMDIPAILIAARKAGVQHYYIEDESDNVLTQVPQSLGYLRKL